MIIRSIVFNDSFSLLFIGDYRVGNQAYVRSILDTWPVGLSKGNISYLL